MTSELVECFRPVNESELALVAASGYRRWPPRLSGQEIFYPVTNKEYAIALTQWNVTDYGVGYVTQFSVKKSFMDRYPVQTVGGRNATEWWVPASDLDELNNNIVGPIRVIAEYRE